MTPTRKNQLKAIAAICGASFILGIGCTLFGVWLHNRLTQSKPAAYTEQKIIKASVDKAETKLAVKEQELNKIADRLKVSSEVNKNNYAVLAAKQLTDIDSLKKLVSVIDTVYASPTGGEYTVIDPSDYFARVEENNKAKDSLFYESIDTLEAVVANRDSLISAQREAHDSLRFNLDRSIQNTDAVLGDNLHLKRENSKLRTGNKLWKVLGGAALIFAGIKSL